MRLKKLLSVVTAVAVALSAVVVAPVAKESVSAATTGEGKGGNSFDIIGYTAATDKISITITPDEVTTDSSTWSLQFIVSTTDGTKYNPYFYQNLTAECTIQEIMDEHSIASYSDITGIGLQVLGAAEDDTYSYSYDITSTISDTPNYSASMEILPDEPNWENGYLRIPTTGLPSISSDVTIEATYSGTRPNWAQIIATNEGSLNGSSTMTDTSADPWITEGVIVCSLTSDAWETCLTQGEFILQTDPATVTGFTSVKLSYKSEGTDTFKQVSAADASNKHRERMVKLVKLSDLENAASVDFTFTTKEKEHTKSAYTYYTSITADGATLTPGTGWVFVTYAITGMPTEASLENISANIVNK